MSNLSLPTDTFNIFPLDPTNHVMQFSRMPMTTFVVQEVNLPGVTAKPAVTASPGLNIHSIPDRLVYDPLTVTFMMDEELRAWRELYAWLLGMTGGYDRSEIVAEFIDQHINYVWPEKAQHRQEKVARTTAALTIINPAKIPMIRVLFNNLYITGLSALTFSTKETDTISNTMSCTATFEYDWYSVVEYRRS
jgi:hypothetical protein